MITQMEIIGTEPGSTEEALLQLEEKYRGLMANSITGIANTDLEGKFTLVNEALCKMTGYGEEELIGKHFTDFLHQNDKQRVMQLFQSAFTSPKGVLSLEIRIVHKKGHILHAMTSPTIMKTDNTMMGFNAIIADITGRRRAEEELRQLKEKFQIMVEEYPLGIALISKDGHYQYVNDKFVEIFGYTLEDIPTGESWFAKAYPGQEYRNLAVVTWLADLKSSKCGEVRPRIFTVRCKDGLKKVIRFRPVSLAADNQLVTYEDITKYKRAAGSQEIASAVTSKRPLTPLQQKFAKSGLQGLTDREVIELLLSFCPCGQPAGLVEKCLKKFRNVRELLSASSQELQQAGLDPQAVSYIRLLYEIPSRVLREKIIERPVFESSKEIFDYLYYSMRDLKKERFKVIYLNSRDQMIDIVDLFEGETGRMYVSPRRIVEVAIENNAATLIFVHNHPSGDSTPSKIDKRLTRDLVFAGNILQIRVLDHIVIGDGHYFSFADGGLIQKYEDDFLRLKVKCI